MQNDKFLAETKGRFSTVNNCDFTMATIDDIDEDALHTTERGASQGVVHFSASLATQEGTQGVGECVHCQILHVNDPEKAGNIVTKSSLYYIPLRPEMIFRILRKMS